MVIIVRKFLHGCVSKCVSAYFEYIFYIYLCVDSWIYTIVELKKVIFPNKRGKNSDGIHALWFGFYPLLS